MINAAGGTFTNAGGTAGAVTNAGTASNTGTIASLTNSGGVFANNGTIAGAVVVSGGTYQGNGSSGGLAVQSGGTAAPGNSVGTLNVTGNVTFAAGSTYLAEVATAAADRITATGTASLNGTLRLVATGTNYMFGPLHAALGEWGAFRHLRGGGDAGHLRPGHPPDGDLRRHRRHLTLAPQALAPVIAGVTTTRNQRAVAAGLDAAMASLGADPASAARASAFFPLYTLQPASLARALDQLSGQAGATATTLTVAAGDQFLRAMLDPGSRTFAEACAPARTSEGSRNEDGRMAQTCARPAGSDPRVSTWATVFGAFGGLRSDGAIGAASQSSSTLGIAVGADYRLTPPTSSPASPWRVRKAARRRPAVSAGDRPTRCRSAPMPRVASARCGSPPRSPMAPRT